MRRQMWRWRFHFAVAPLVRPIACIAAFSAVFAISIAAHAQKQSDAETTLIQKAQALESRGRPDIAVQVWQQILLSDPNNALALEGVARDYRLSGNSTASDEALDRLRRANPSDPNISRIQGLTSNKTRDVRLGQAGALAKAGNADAAMSIYKEYYGDHPPDGDIALAYYETLYATSTGKQEALNAMRALATRNPGDQRFIVTLGRMLTYDARTRSEGIKILHEHMDNSDAQNSLRQALVWDSANPASAAELKEYLKTHPQDTELEERLKTNESKLAEMHSGVVRSPEERAAFAALNAHRLPEAEALFQSLLEKDEKNSRAAAGMGYLRMQQSNFGGAISYLVQAEQNGSRDRSVVEGLATSRFWFTMGEASAAFDANQLDVAIEKYKAALDMRNRSPEALNGLAGVYTKNQQYPAAAEVYQLLLKVQPGSEDAWRGLFLSYARNHQTQQAMSVMARFPPAVKNAVNRDPDFLQTLATIYQSSGRDADAQRVLAQALSLPFPDNGANLKTGTRLQYAGILMAAKRFDQAAELYKQVLNDDTSSLPAWMGLVTAEHQLQQDGAAIELVEKMPPDTYEAALTDPGFLSMLGSIYAQSNQFEIAQGLMERSVRLQTQSGGQPALGLQIQLASIYLQRNNTAQAYALYKQILESHPDNLDAWRGLIGTLQSTNRNTEALQEIKLIPPAVRKQLEEDVQFEQSEASLYAGAGDTVNAIALFNHVQKHYAALQQEPPADVDIQSAYLLYNTKNDRALYPTLMRLGAREDLTNQQRETIQGLWANWSVRRSATAFDNGNTARAIDILDAAAQAFPDNLDVRKAVAGGYLRAGKSREALAVFKQIDMQDASAADFAGAISTALASNDKTQAETWLRQALERYPHDATILAQAARFEQARGDNGRAADYWRASLAAMLEVSPTDKLAHELVNPEPIKPNSRAATPNDLANLLNPDQEQVDRTGQTRKLPPLPAYGHDPYDPSAPVVLSPQTRGVAASRAPVYPVPTTTTVPLPSSDLNYSTAEVAPPPRYRARPAATHTTAPAPVAPLTTPPAAPATKPGAATRTRHSTHRNDTSSGSYSGRMHLPPSEETVTSTDSTSTGQPGSQTNQPVYPQYTPPQSVPQQPASPQPMMPQAAPPQSYSPQPYSPQPYSPQPVSPQPVSPQPVSPQIVTPQLVPQRYQPPSQQRNRPTLPPLRAQSSAPLPNNNPPVPDQSLGNSSTAGLRLSSQPMNPAAARAQSLLAGETDSQLTQGLGFGNPIHYLQNANPAAQTTAPIPSSGSPYNSAALSNAQYTPSAQDAAAGAYSAQKPNTPPPPQVTVPELVPPPVIQTPQTPQTSQPLPPPQLTGTTHKRRKSKPLPSGPASPTLVTAPGQEPVPQLPVTDSPAQSPAPTSTTGLTDSGLTDQELQERNLPPLRGPWARLTHREPTVLSPRDEAEMQLRTIEGGYSAWVGGTGDVNHRSGAAGYDGLTSLDTLFEASVPLGTTARFTILARPVFLDSGQADGNAVVTLSTGIVAEPFGTGDATDGGKFDPSANPPPQQNAAGIAGEAQLTFANLSLAGGYTPYGFLISNWTARAAWRPNRGPFTFSFTRDSVKDTQLSYAGLRDPYSATPFFPGNVWGGVISNAGAVQYARGDLNSGFYVGVGGQSLTGLHVKDNRRYDGSMGAYWRVFTMPEYGQLNVGANFFAMHYTTNLQGFTYGMGGYFSPQAYFLANVPVTWTGHYKTRWHYVILGSFGLQAFENKAESIFPLLLNTTLNTPSLPALTSVGPNYDLRGQMAYAISDHWFVGGFAGANNSRNYTTVNAGFSVRYLFRSQPSTVAGPTGLFQSEGLRPLTVP